MPTYYINADSGDNSTGDGSSGTPWETLAHAYDNSSSGDTIICQTSTASYAWVSDTLSNRTIQAADSDNPAVFDGSGIGVAITADGTAFQDIIFQNATNTGAQSPIFRLSDLTFTRCTFRSLIINSSGGVYGGLTGGVNPSIFTGNIEIVLDTCLFDDLVKTTGSTGYLFPCRWSNNYTITFTISNCTLYFGTGTDTIDDIFVDSTSDTTPISVTITNTIVSNDTGTTINFDLAGGPLLGTVTSNSNNYYNVSRQPSGTNDITSDPQFIDPSNDNFNLQIDSPARAAGTTP